jgi:acyl carrier protein
MDWNNTLMEYIRDEFARNRGADIKEDEDLLSSGLIDSLGILKLVSFIEDRFGIEVPGEDVVYENFCSVEAMTRYLAGREKG